MSPDQQVDAFLCEYLRAAIEVRRERGDVFEITVSDFEADRARRLAEAVANQFVAASKAAQLEASRSTQSFSAEQEQVYRRKLAESEARLEAASRAALAGGVTQVDGSNVVRGPRPARAGQPRARGAAAEAGRTAGPGAGPRSSRPTSARCRARARDAGRAARRAGPPVLRRPGGGERGQRRLGRARAHRAQVRRAGEPSWSARRRAALPALPADARDLLVRTRLAQADLAAKQAGRDEIAGQVSGYQREQALSPDRDLTLQRLRQEVETNRTLYNSFVQQSASAQIRRPSRTRGSAGASACSSRRCSRWRRRGPTGRSSSCWRSCSARSWAWARCWSSSSTTSPSRTPRRSRTCSACPCWARCRGSRELVRSVAPPRRAGRGRAAVRPAGGADGLLHRLKVESPLGLEFRRVYLKLAKTRGRALPRTLLVTSATRGEGKTTTTACLAITLARELRERVLLVDFDLRSPALHRALGLPSSTWGLAQMLRDRNFDERHVRTTALAQLDFLPAGRTETPAGELVDTAACEWFFQEASSRYSLVVVDAPPNLAVPDPLILGRAVEGVLYVIKAGSTIRKAAEYGVKVQREARDNVLGILMNDAGEMLPSYYGYRAHGYGYTSEEAGGA